jgi:hypothetical protein
LNGRLSQKQAADIFRCKPPTISEAFKIMTNKRLIGITTAPDLERKIRQEKFYKLLAQGLSRFIKGDPSVDEFWVAIIWYGTFNSESANKEEFNGYYNDFIHRFIGDNALRSCFFLGNLFENLFVEWRRDYFESRKNIIAVYTYTEAVKAYKVLECLLLNRGITASRIVKLTKLTEQDVRKVIEDHSMTQSIYSQYIDDYETIYRSSRSVDKTLSLLNHLLIVPMRAKNENEKYELSLLGILLTLALISLRRKEESHSYVNYYKITASSYHEKLPLIFGKWELLDKILDFSAYPSILDYLLGDYISKSEILSLSVSLGGNKEIYDNIRSSTLNTMNKYFTIYDGGINALQSVDYPDKFRDTLYFRLILEKINEIEMSLKYSDLVSFGEYMKNKKKSESNSFNFEDDLHFIENALADEFTFLFYVGQIRENNYKASDYPLTTNFIRSNPSVHCPRDFLYRIVASDVQILTKLNEWIAESKTYQQQALAKMDDIYRGFNN